jgi:UDP-N-acetylglucosamine 4-epimerase
MTEMGIKPIHGPDGRDIHSLASVDKAKRLLGYNPTFTVKEGMTEAIKWYRSNL